MVHLSSSSRQTPRQRLPELSDVLMRKTRAPLDLYCFYIFLQQENAEDALDFWLDVQQHENLCRAYFKVGVCLLNLLPPLHLLSA